jgi:hypothetical protein
MGSIHIAAGQQGELLAKVAKLQTFNWPAIAVRVYVLSWCGGTDRV